MFKLRVILAGVFLTGASVLPSSPVNATGWSPISGDLSCIEGTSGTTGLRSSSSSFGSEDGWTWTSISGDENNFSLTLNFVESGIQLDPHFYRFFAAFREIGSLCTASFIPWNYDWPPGSTPFVPPPARFVAITECTPTVTGSNGSSTGTASFQNLGAIFDPPSPPPDDRPEFQVLTLNLEPQTAAGTYTYTISFVCGADDEPEFGGGGWDFNLDHYLTRGEEATSSALPNTL
jgi:hypothetical protein